MLPYIIFYAFIFIISFKIIPKKYTFFDFLLLLVLIGFAGVRLNIGTDYVLYERIYRDISMYSALDSRTGVGFSILMQLFKNVLHLSYPFFIFFISALTNTLLYFYIKKFSEKPGRTLLLYISIGLYGFSFNGFRQGLSIILMLYGLMHLQNGKNVRAIIWYFFSFFCHTSTIVGILLSLLFVKNKKMQLKLVYIIPIFTILFFNYEIIFSFFLKNISSYNMYLNTSNQYAAGLGTFLNAFLFIIFYFIFAWNNIRKNKTKEIDNTTLLYFNLVTIGTPILLLGVKNWLFVRFSYQFIIFYIFLMDIYYEKNNIEKKKFTSLFFYVFMYAYFLMNTYFFNGLIPYQSIF